MHLDPHEQKLTLLTSSSDDEDEPEPSDQDTMTAVRRRMASTTAVTGAAPEGKEQRRGENKQRREMPCRALANRVDERGKRPSGLRR